MAEKNEREPFSGSRIVITAVFHAVLFVLFIIFLGYIVPGFAVTAEDSGAELPAPAQLIIRLAGFVGQHWYWAIPLVAAADTAALIMVGRFWGKRGLLVWSVVVSGIFAGIMIVGMIGMMNAVARMG